MHEGIGAGEAVVCRMEAGSGNKHGALGSEDKYLGLSPGQLYVEKKLKNLQKINIKV